ncbi:MAG: hypothetical protein Q7W51_00220 [Coriobacteriia bacterium]|nr:hypothetical protein [Coriobacteriia bacterium]
MGDARAVSGRTWGVAAAGLGLIAVLEGLNIAGVGGEALEAWVSNAPLTLVTIYAASIVIWAALQFSAGVPIRRQWLFIGLGVLAFGLGNVVWTLYAAQGLEPFPSLADIGYSLLYPLAAYGIWSALLSFRRMFDIKTPLAVGAAIAAVATGTLYFSLFQTIAADTETSVLGKVLSIGYPIGDMWLLLLPAIAIAIVASRMAGGRIAWPWYATCVGLVLISAADSLYAVQSWNGTYQSGSYVDIIWCVGFTAIAVGASVLLDVQKAGGTKSAAERSSEGGEQR